MSHFTVMVIGNDYEKQLAPFDENISVPAYDTGIVDEKAIQRFVEYYTTGDGAKKHGKVVHFVVNGDRDDVANLYSTHGKAWNDNVWRKHSDGTWHEWSTYNPKSKWDWYILGGRWSGEVIKLKDGAKGKVGESGSVGNPVGVDQAMKKDIANIDQISTFAVVKDGEWYERGEMGWWGCVSNEMDENEWGNKVRELLEGLPDETLISIVDCHI